MHNCEPCNYKTPNKNNYAKHLLTSKHNLNNLQNYNFLSFCKVDFPYTFTESNIPKSEYVYRNIFDGEKWEYLRFDREKYEQSN